MDRACRENRAVTKAGRFTALNETISGFISFRPLASDVCVGLKAAEIRFAVQITLLVLLKIK